MQQILYHLFGLLLGMILFTGAHAQEPEVSKETAEFYFSISGHKANF